MPENRKTVEQEGDVISNTVLKAWKNTGGAKYLKNNQNYSNHSIFKILKNTQKSLGDLSRLAVFHTPLKDYKTMLLGKSEIIIIIIIIIINRHG